MGFERIAKRFPVTCIVVLAVMEFILWIGYVGAAGALLFTAARLCFFREVLVEINVFMQAGIYIFASIGIVTVGRKICDPLRQALKNVPPPAAIAEKNTPPADDPTDPMRSM